jgi:hypothetical protein
MGGGTVKRRDSQTNTVSRTGTGNQGTANYPEMGRKGMKVPFVIALPYVELDPRVLKPEIRAHGADAQELRPR